MKKKVLLAGLLAVLAASSFVAAQDWKGKGRLGGLVLDQAGAPVEGVRVKLFSLKAQEGIEVKTDKSGRWMAAWIRSGGWNLDFEKVGYMPKKLVVEISENKKNPDVEIKLEKVEGLVLTDEMKDLLTRGNDLFDKNDYAGALAVYEELLVKYPDAYPVYLNIGNCHFAQEKYDLAEEILPQAPGEGPEERQRPDRRRQLLRQPRRRRQGPGVVRQGRVREDRRTPRSSTTWARSTTTTPSSRTP